MYVRGDLVEYRLVNYLKELDVDNVKKEVEKMLSQNVDPQEIQRQLLLGLQEIGNKYESGEYYIGDLIVSGMLMKDILSLQGGILSTPITISTGNEESCQTL